MANVGTDGVGCTSRGGVQVKDLRPMVVQVKDFWGLQVEYSQPLPNP